MTRPNQYGTIHPQGRATLRGGGHQIPLHYGKPDPNTSPMSLEAAVAGLDRSNNDNDGQNISYSWHRQARIENDLSSKLMIAKRN